MTTTHISVDFMLDTDIIAQDIYATSALHFYLSDHPTARPAPLSPDNKGALAPIIHNAASFIVLSMLPYVEDFTLNTGDNPMIHITLKVASSSMPPLTIRRILETVIASYPQHLVYTTSNHQDLADTYRAQALAMLNDLKTLLCGNNPPRLKPCLF